MDERWWPGLRDHLAGIPARAEKREAERRANNGWRIPAWISGVSEPTPPGARLAGAVLGFVLGILWLLAAGADTFAMVGLFFVLVLPQFGVDRWYAVGARRLRESDPSLRAP